MHSISPSPYPSKPHPPLNQVNTLPSQNQNLNNEKKENEKKTKAKNLLAALVLRLHTFPLLAIWQVAQAPPKKPSRKTHTEKRPAPDAQWVHGGSLTTPRAASRQAPRVCTRSLSVDFSGGSSLPSRHGMGRTGGRARRRSRESLGRPLRRRCGGGA